MCVYGGGSAGIQVRMRHGQRGHYLVRDTPQSFFLALAAASMGLPAMGLAPASSAALREELPVLPSPLRAGVTPPLPDLPTAELLACRARGEPAELAGESARVDSPPALLPSGEVAAAAAPEPLPLAGETAPADAGLAPGLPRAGEEACLARGLLLPLLGDAAGLPNPPPGEPRRLTLPAVDSLPPAGLLPGLPTLAPPAAPPRAAANGLEPVIKAMLALPPTLEGAAGPRGESRCMGLLAPVGLPTVGPAKEPPPGDAIAAEPPAGLPGDSTLPRPDLAPIGGPTARRCSPGIAAAALRAPDSRGFMPGETMASRA